MATKVLRGFAAVWFSLATVVIVASLVVVWWNHSFAAVQEIMSPFNVWNLIAVLITLSPGLAAQHLAERLERRVVEP